MYHSREIILIALIFVVIIGFAGAYLLNDYNLKKTLSTILASVASVVLILLCFLLYVEFL